MKRRQRRKIEAAIQHRDSRLVQCIHKPPQKSPARDDRDNSEREHSHCAEIGDLSAYFITDQKPTQCNKEQAAKKDKTFFGHLKRDIKKPAAWIGLVTLIVLGIYTGFAGRQADEMRRSNEATRNALSITQKAYVTIGRKDGIVGELILPKDPRDKIGVVIYFQNSGHLPAKFNWGTNFSEMPFTDSNGTRLPFEQFKSNHVFNRMIRTRNRKNGSVGEAGGNGGVIAGDSLFIADLTELPPERIGELKAPSKAFLVDGAFEYCDDLGNYSWRTFILFYQGDPYHTFRLVSDMARPGPIAPMVSKPDPDLEYLLPCKTMAEQEQEKKETVKTPWWKLR